MEKFDVIIAGAGLAGLAAAYTLAGNGVEVLVLERGDYPGAKNVTGGRLYVNPVRDLFPGLWDEAPLERFIVHEGAVLMARERSVAVRYSGNELRAEPRQSYSVLRARFDRWLADRTEAKGAMLRRPEGGLRHRLRRRTLTRLGNGRPARARISP